MKQSRFTDSQIIAILKPTEAGAHHGQLSNGLSVRLLNIIFSA